MTHHIIIMFEKDIHPLVAGMTEISPAQSAHHFNCNTTCATETHQQHLIRLIK